MRPAHVLPVVLAAIILPAAVGAQSATTIDFAEFACTGLGFGVYDSPLDTRGYRFTAEGRQVRAFVVPCSGQPSYAGTAAIASNSFQPFTLTSLAGAPFSMQSIDMGPGFPVSDAHDYTFIGTLVGGATVTQTFRIEAGPGSGAHPTLATYTFLPTFSNLTSLRFTADAPRATTQFTNLRLTQALPAAVVPEPATWALVGAGLLGVGGMTRRRHRSGAPAVHGGRVGRVGVVGPAR